MSASFGVEWQTHPTLGISSAVPSEILFLGLLNREDKDARLDLRLPESAMDGRLELLTESLVALDPPVLEEILLFRFLVVKLNFRMFSVMVPILTDEAALMVVMIAAWSERCHGI